MDGHYIGSRNINTGAFLIWQFGAQRLYFDLHLRYMYTMLAEMVSSKTTIQICIYTTSQIFPKLYTSVEFVQRETVSPTSTPTSQLHKQYTTLVSPASPFTHEEGTGWRD